MFWCPVLNFCSCDFVPLCWIVYFSVWGEGRKRKKTKEGVTRVSKYEGACLLGCRAIIRAMEAVSTSETSVSFYQTTLRNIPEDVLAAGRTWNVFSTPDDGNMSSFRNAMFGEPNDYVQGAVVVMTSRHPPKTFRLSEVNKPEHSWGQCCRWDECFMQPRRFRTHH
jgi:hypothetical protein